MAEFSENRHISNLINMSCKVFYTINSIDYNIEYGIFGGGSQI